MYLLFSPLIFELKQLSHSGESHFIMARPTNIFAISIHKQKQRKKVFMFVFFGPDDTFRHTSGTIPAPFQQSLSIFCFHWKFSDTRECSRLRLVSTFAFALSGLPRRRENHGGSFSEFHVSYLRRFDAAGPPEIFF